jgi:hypothetical protein
MTIYTSDKAMPYVYMCINKYTGAFYIGYRAKNAKLGKPRAPMSDEARRKISETKKLKALEKSLVK